MTRQPPSRRHAFTLVEMLVVIGIIVVLMAILVPVVSRMRLAVQTANTNAQLQRISSAINNYFNDFHAYPGLTHNAKFNPTSSKIPDRFFDNLTQSEDLTVALLGGARVTPRGGGGYDFAFDPQSVGQGPYNINSANIVKKSPYFPKRDEELSPGADGLLNNETEFGYVQDSLVPEFMDLYPEQRPVLYLRCGSGIPKTRATDPSAQRILGPKGRFDAARFGYNWDSIEMYLKTTAKGYNDKTADFAGKVANSPATEPELFRYFAGASGELPRNAGGYLLISAGPNRLFGDGDDIIYGGGGGQ